MMTKKHYPMHPAILEEIEQQPDEWLQDVSDAELLERVQDAMHQATYMGLVRVGDPDEHETECRYDFDEIAVHFLTSMKAALKRGLIHVEQAGSGDEKQVVLTTVFGRHMFARNRPANEDPQDPPSFPHADDGKSDDEYDDQDEYDEYDEDLEDDEQDEPQDFRSQVFSRLYGQEWEALWLTTFNWSHEIKDNLTELENQDLIELRYPEKGVGDVTQEFMLSPFGIIQYLTQQPGYVGLNQARSKKTRAMVHQARGLLEQMGFKITSHKANMVENNLFAPDITFATDEGYLLNALVESEPFLGYEAVEKYQVMWHKNFYNTIQNKMYVFCENKQVLRDVLNFIMSRYEDVKPPGIYLCNLEEAERNMQEKGHPWSIVQTPGRQESKVQNSEPEQSGTIEPKESTP